jgi:hypothetical protein
MRTHRGPGGSRLAFASALILIAAGASTRPTSAQSSTPASSPARPSPAGAVQSSPGGAALFVGQARFENGGPPCGSCHQLSTLGFPNGGTVGPDLSPAYQTLGPDGTDVTLKTLFFPTMVPLYEKRPLTTAEQDALKVLLQQASPTAQEGRYTAELAGIAAAGFLALVALTWIAWRHRLLGVRAPLLRARTGGTVRKQV